MTASQLVRREGGQELALAIFAWGAITLDDRRDLGAMNADIGERAVVQSHQLAIGLLPAPPFGDGVPRGGEETDNEDVRTSTLWCNAQDGDW